MWKLTDNLGSPRHPADDLVMDTRRTGHKLAAMLSPLTALHPTPPPLPSLSSPFLRSLSRPLPPFLNQSLPSLIFPSSPHSHSPLGLSGNYCHFRQRGSRGSRRSRGAGGSLCSVAATDEALLRPASQSPPSLPSLSL